MANLTVKTIDALKAEEKRQEIPDSGKGAVPGLYIVVQPSGAKSWSFRYRSPINGKPTKYTVGVYPTCTFAEARTSAFELRRKVAMGIDPAEEKKAARARAFDTSRDIGPLLDRFIKDHVDTKRPSTARLLRNQIEADIRPEWGKRRIETITREDVEALLDPILARGAPVHANRVFSLVRLFLGWCVTAKGVRVINVSPADGVVKPSVEVGRDHVLSNQELRWLWSACCEAGSFGSCIRLLLLTGQRRSEVGGMHWSEVTDGEWLIPKARTKNGREQLVPLNATALEILATLPRIDDSDIVFTGDGVTVSSGWSKSKLRLDKLMLAAAEKEAGENGTAPIVRPWTIHDLRRTATSGMARLGIQPHVLEAVLNHKSGIISGVAARYNQYAYRAEKAEALNAWAAHLQSVVDGSTNVVPIRSVR